MPPPQTPTADGSVRLHRVWPGWFGTDVKNTFQQQACVKRPHHMAVCSSSSLLFWWQQETPLSQSLRCLVPWSVPWSGRQFEQCYYFIKDPGGNVFDIFLGAGCYDCEEDRCWCTILTAPRKGHPIYFLIKPWRSWSPSQQWDNSKTCQPVCCMTGLRVISMASTEIESRYTTGSASAGPRWNSGRSSLPQQRSLCAMCWEGTACLPLVSQGPLSFHAGGSAMSTEGMVAPSEMQPLTSRRRWTWPKPPLMKGSEICVVRQIRKRQLVLVAHQLLSTPQPGPGQAAVTSYPTVGPRKRQ